MDSTISTSAKKFRNAADTVVTDLSNEYSDEIRGRVQDAVNTAQKSYSATADTVRSTVTEQPLISLLAASAIGLIAGLFIARR